MLRNQNGFFSKFWFFIPQSIFGDGKIVRSTRKFVGRHILGCWTRWYVFCSYKWGVHLNPYELVIYKHEQFFQFLKKINDFFSHEFFTWICNEHQGNFLPKMSLTNNKIRFKVENTLVIWDVHPSTLDPNFTNRLLLLMLQ